MEPKPSPPIASSTKRFVTILLLLCGLLGLMFFQELLPGNTLFSNDGPLGTLISQSHHLPGGFRWQDLNTVGYREGGPLPGVTYGLLLLVGPIAYSKLYAPIGLLILGLGSWSFFRQLRLAPVACVLGSIATMLNFGFFSEACWGLAGHAVTFGMTFFALGLLANRNSRGRWIRVALAGLAVGIGVAEGADIGGIFSLFVAGFAMYQGYVEASEAQESTQSAGLSRIETMFLWTCLAGCILLLFGGGALWLAESSLHLKTQFAHLLAAKLGGFVLLLIVAFTVALWLAMVKGKPLAQRLVRGTPRVAMVAGFALFIAVQAVSGLLAVSIQGVAGVGQDTEANWTFATQWSLPKKEALGLVVPGLFGYRMDTPQGLPQWAQKRYEGGAYWGGIGSDPIWDRYYEAKAQGQQVARPEAMRRFGGAGPYAGVLVELLAVWAAVQSFRKKDSVYSLYTRRAIWFWVFIVVASLPLAFGRFAPFYQIPYSLIPYFSNIRNPIKFLYPVSMGLVVLFGYGLHGLWRRYVSGATIPVAGAAGVSPASSSVSKASASSRRQPGGSKPETAGRRAAPQFATETAAPQRGLKSWWQTVRGFDRGWTIGCLMAFGVCLLAFLLYWANTDSLVNEIIEAGFNDPNNGQAMAKAMASFSIVQVMRSLVILAIAIVLVILVMSGVLGGKRARWAGIAMGVLLVVDLGLANQPWILVWNYQQKYASDQVLDLLRQKPYEHRVAAFPLWLGSGGLQPKLEPIEQYFRHGVYGLEWAQQQFLYYNIQSLDLVQMPRMPEDLAWYRGTFEYPYGTRDPQEIMRRISTRVARYWELTNTRYLLGAAGWLDLLNQLIDPGEHRFRMVEQFEMRPKPGVEEPMDPTKPVDFSKLSAVPRTNGPFALYEFTGALPRAKLYANWQVNTNDAAALEQLASKSFDPQTTVLVDSPLPAPATAATTNLDAGSVEITDYAPTHLKLAAKAAAGSVLLLNDRYEPNWHVWVDGNPAPLLKCNYLMRGVYLTPGAHTIEFRFQPPEKMFYVSLTAFMVGAVLCGILFVMSTSPSPEENKQRPAEPRAKEEVASAKG